MFVDAIDTRQIDPADLRRNIGYMPQNVMLVLGHRSAEPDAGSAARTMHPC